MNQEIPSPLVICDFVDQDGLPQRRLFSNPTDILSANSVAEIYPALRKIQQLVSQGYFAAGYLSYEAAPAFDPAFKVHPKHKMPLLWFGIFAKPGTELDLPWVDTCSTSCWKSKTSRKQYNIHIKKIKRALSRGDTYQVNYTMRLRARFEGDDLGYYHRLKSVQRSDYSVYINTGRFRILSVSPELFFKINGKTVTTRPMKGTMPRGRWLEEDQEFAAKLSASAKDQAENGMIVDLLRNDLSKIPGVISVQVPRLFDIEPYPTVYQMTSTVTATVSDNTTFVDVLEALFPCGSITGAPKISTMGLIAELEQSPREVYCGTIGIIEPSGDALFNVAIRTVFMDSETGIAEYGIGGGVTWDSTTEGEYAEAFAKAALLERVDLPFELLETMKLEHGEYALFHRHMTRLSSSARYFAISLDLGMITDSLQEHARQYEGKRRRVRLLVSQSGEVRVESTALSELSHDRQIVAMASTPTSKENRFLYHKTTRRDVYTHHQNEHPNVYDVLLWNEDGHITEFTNGNIVLEIDGRKVTPAREYGLLAGTFRAHLLDEGVIEEGCLRSSDIGIASQIWLINSVRGWVPVCFEATHDH